jgi:CheY-like chemotaxis protein
VSQQQRPLILLVEDNPDDADLIAYAFRKAGIAAELRVVDDGEKAVDYLAGAGPYADRDLNPVPVLVLLDLKLPRRSGFEVLAWMRQHPSTSLLTVVVLTSSNQDADVRRAYVLGANSYLVKPVSRDALLDMVRTLNYYWLFLNQPAA